MKRLNSERMVITYQNEDSLIQNEQIKTLPKFSDTTFGPIYEVW